jgi:hypothetical protein
MMNAKDLLARLLANENLNVIRANVRTASFESRSRTLTLPQWKEMTDDVEEMLIGHEVGHALYTTNDYFEMEDFRKLHGYMNVIEDVRIEKFVKNKYPGLRKAFIQGYKQLNEKDFFGIQDKDLSKLLLIDRINLYYKVGFNCGAKFTPEEMEMVRKVDRCDTPDDVYELAKEIYGYSKEQRQKMQSEIDELFKLNGEDLPEDDEYDDGDDSWDIDPSYDEDPDETQEEINEEVETTKKTSGSAPQFDKTKDVEEELESQTQQSFHKRLSELADVDTMVMNYSPEFMVRRDPIVPTKTVLKDLDEEWNAYITRCAENYSKEWCDMFIGSKKESNQKFKTNSARIVNYLVKEFEMKKSASEYKRTSTSKSGDLDIRKLYAYKLTDDMFKKIEVVPEDKNHGMIFLLDWSGSMQDVISDTVKQVINLAMFCQRIQIPYKVFAFSSAYDQGNYVHHRVIDSDQKGFVDTQYHLLEFFNNKMTNSEFNRMVDHLLNEPWRYGKGYGLNSTPLNESLLFLSDYIGKFIGNNAVEKMSLVTLTDGEGHGLQPNEYGGIRDYTRVTEPNGFSKQMKVVNYLTDPVTKKQYKITNIGSEQTRVLLRMIKDRYNIKTVGFHVTSTGRRNLESFIQNNMTATTRMDQLNLVEQFRKDLRQHDYAIVPNTGRDELYLLPASKQKIEEGELQVQGDMSAKAIASKFAKYLDVKKSSRVVLNRFVSIVA